MTLLSVLQLFISSELFMHRVHLFESGFSDVLSLCQQRIWASFPLSLDASNNQVVFRAAVHCGGKLENRQFLMSPMFSWVFHAHTEIPVWKQEKSPPLKKKKSLAPADASVQHLLTVNWLQPDDDP